MKKNKKRVTRVKISNAWSPAVTKIQTRRASKKKKRKRNRMMDRQVSLSSEYYFDNAKTQILASDRGDFYRSIIETLKNCCVVCRKESSSATALQKI